MARLSRLLLILIALLNLGASCQGTETGNPGTPQAGGEDGEDGEVQENETYTNGDFGVIAEYDQGWNFTENTPSGSVEESPAADQPEGVEPMVPMVEEEIDTSEAPSTEFTDGASIVTLFFVTLDSEPVTLIGYLQQVFSSRVFESFANAQGLSGYFYDNPEAGATGGDRQEYYFLNGTLLLYVAAEVFEANDGLEKFATIIESLRFH